MMMGGRLEANVEEDLFKVGTDWVHHYIAFTGFTGFYWCFTGVLLVFYWCFTGVLLVFYWCFTGVLLVFYWCFTVSL